MQSDFHKNFKRKALVCFNFFPSNDIMNDFRATLEQTSWIITLKAIIIEEKLLASV